jgi:hypothetical protein
MNENHTPSVKETDVFSYTLSKESKVFISWKGKRIMVLKGNAAQKLVSKLVGADEAGIQLELAKITGNFKRGNERLNSK